MGHKIKNEASASNSENKKMKIDQMEMGFSDSEDMDDTTDIIIPDQISKFLKISKDQQQHKKNEKPPPKQTHQNQSRGRRQPHNT